MAELGLEHRFYRGVSGPWMVRDGYHARRATELEIALRDALLASQRRELAAAEHLRLVARREPAPAPSRAPALAVAPSPNASEWQVTMRDQIGDWLHDAWHEKRSDLAALATVLVGAVVLLYLVLR
ncbi:MAG TPA: hypothetical protein VFA19_15660 [Gaiellaceae bacterium]|nr:hypothetical protein [Gaiellaceae bacterium]